jgi:hypothetical protein
MNVPRSDEEPKDTTLASIEQITSMEDLHKTLRIVNIRGWLSFAFIALIVVAAIVWAFVGRLPVSVTGKCVVVHGENGFPLTILGFVPLLSGQQIHPGMEAKILLDSIDTARYGMIEGRVQEISSYPIDAKTSVLQQIPSASLREYLTEGSAPTTLLVIEPVLDPQTVSGLKWTSKTGPPTPVTEGSIGEAIVILKTLKPISYVIPQL